MKKHNSISHFYILATRELIHIRLQRMQGSYITSFMEFKKKKILAKPSHNFAYLCLINVKMYTYAKFDQNIPCGLRVMSIFFKDLNLPKLCLANPCHRFAYAWLDNIKINKYAQFDPNIPLGSRIMRNFSN